MKGARVRKLPGYAAKVIESSRRAGSEGRMPRGGVYVIDVLHDDDCPCLLGTGTCACDADVGEPRLVQAPEVV